MTIKPAYLLLLSVALVFAIKFLDPHYTWLSRWMTSNWIETCPRQVDKLGCVSLDAWAVTHVALFAYLSYYYPARRFQWFALGVVWEIAEAMLAEVHSRQFWEESITEQLMDALVWNVLGIVLGSYLRHEKKSN